MQLRALVDVSRQVGATRSRLHKTALLADLLAQLATAEIRVGVSYLMGAVPQGRIGIGYVMVRGLEDVPAASRATLKLLEVDSVLTQLARAAGTGAGGERKRLLATLLTRATPDEQSFVARLLVGELRQGALEGIMIEAIARAAKVPVSDVRRASMLSGRLDAVAEAALTDGARGLARFRLTLFRPLLPMLAQPAADIDEAMAALGEAALEYKLDGARIQVHRDQDELRIYSRDGHDVTARVPELVEPLLALPASSFVLDGEVVSLRRDGRPRPFQETMRRFGRRLNVDTMRVELPLSPFFFDVLHQDGVDVLDQTGSERARQLSELLPASLRVPRLVTDSIEAADAFYAEALARGHEGLLAKSLSAPYAAGRRGGEWLKLKPAHTLDLVVLAVEWGSGRRTGWLSNLHLGARDGCGHSGDGARHSPAAKFRKTWCSAPIATLVPRP